MSTNGQLVFTDVDKITFKGVGNASNAVIDTLTGKIGVGVDSPDANLHVLGNSYVSTNLELGGTLIMGTVNVEAQHSLEAVTATGNITPLTIEFTNPTTSLVASGNVVVTGNVTADHFVGDGSNITGISSTLQAITDSGNVTSNTVQFTNPTTSLVASGNVVVTGNVTADHFVGDGSNITGISSTLQAITDSGPGANVTSNTVQFTNATTSLVASGNVVVDTNTLFVDSVNNRVGIGTDSPNEPLDIYGAGIRIHHLGAEPKIDFLRGGTNRTPSGALNTFGAANYTDWRIGASGANLKFQQQYIGANSGNIIDVMTMEYGTGNVGIGTNAPGKKLHIYTTATESNSQLELESADRYASMQMKDNSGGVMVQNDQGDLRLLTGYSSTMTGGSETMRIKGGTGNIGIGTSSPGNKLHLYGGTDLLFLEKSSSTGGVGIKFTDYNGSGVDQFGYLRYYHQDSPSYNFKNMLKFSSNQTTEVFAIGGSLMIGVDGKDGGYMTNAGASGRKNLFIQSTYGGNTSQTHGWWIGAQNQTPSSSDNDLYFGCVRSGTIKISGVVLDQNTNGTMNFTGQHRTFVKDTPTNQLVDKEGLIVSADQNEFVKMSGGVVCGNEAITINESLPLVSLATKANDKKCFGVLSTTEDPETRKEVYGNFASNMQKEEGDTRVYVNSVGEGAVWVTNINGTLESGDYITTSNVAGYGMKQNDDILHNYTVAKILMDCDFNPTTQPKRIIKKEAKMIDYWIRYGDVKITEEEYTTLPETKRKIIEDVHYRIDQMEVLKEDPEKDSFVYEQREDMVNVLDEHGEFQWEDTDETEKAYKIRYLDANGVITDEANAVHKAAFVGCTYHCG